MLLDIQQNRVLALTMAKNAQRYRDVESLYLQAP